MGFQTVGLDVWLQWGDNTVNVAEFLEDQTLRLIHNLFAKQWISKSYMFRGGASLDATLSLDGMLMRSPSTPLKAILDGADKEIAVLYHHRVGKVFIHLPMLLSNAGVEPNDGIWTMSGELELNGDFVIGDAFTGADPNWTFVSSGSQQGGGAELDTDVAVDFNVHDTAFVMLISDKDGAPGDVNIGSSHEFGVVVTPEPKLASPNQGAQFTWANSGADALPARFDDATDEYIIYRFQVTNPVEAVNAATQAVRGYHVSFYNGSTGSTYKLDGPKNMLGYGRIIRL